MVILKNLGDCVICHTIVRHVDDYIKDEEYIKGMLKLTRFYHRNCYKERVSPTKQINDLKLLADNITNKMAQLLSGVKH